MPQPLSVSLILLASLKRQVLNPCGNDWVPHPRSSTSPRAAMCDHHNTGALPGLFARRAIGARSDL